MRPDKGREAAPRDLSSCDDFAGHFSVAKAVLREEHSKRFGYTLRMAEALHENALRKQLAAEGFSHTFVWQDGPNAYYPDHTHGGLTAHIILNGEMTLTQAGESQTYRVGERCDVAAGAVHSAKMGPSGCRYLVGEK